MNELEKMLCRSSSQLPAVKSNRGSLATRLLLQGGQVVGVVLTHSFFLGSLRAT